MNILQTEDTICAIATAQGGAIGTIRVSGPEAITLTDRIFKPVSGKPLAERAPYTLTFGHILTPEGEIIDEVLVSLFRAPHSYTGQDSTEISCHGSSYILQQVMQLLIRQGCRAAGPGEYTQRAFLNGKMDLSQAEAVADLIEANSSAAVRAAARSLQGEFSKRIHDINTDLLELRAYIEATIDFPEEEIDFIESGHVNERVAAIAQKLVQLQNAAMRGKVLREGLTVVLAGAPNVGKSSLMNALACDDVAIVTNIAGTTRDRITHTIHLDGLAVNLIDTAGVRHTDNEVERIGIERTLQSVETADIVLLLRSADQAESREEEEALSLILPRLREGVEFLNVFNKIDLAAEEAPKDAICISAKTGEGVETLVSHLKTIAGESESEEGDFLARARHLDCLARACEHLHVLAGNAVGRTVGLDIAAEELRLAGNALGEIVGETTPDNLLGMIFSKFCIGK